jgi:hypothetical protein
MKHILHTYAGVLILLLFSTTSQIVTGNDTLTSVTWDINSLSTIGGHSVTADGDPQVVTTDIGDAVEFDGIEDRLLIDNNPIGDAKEFTVEVYFKPAAAYIADGPNNQPRFIHIQDPDDPVAKRILIELRITESNQWYLDGFIKTDVDDLVLIDETKVHPTEEWMHAAVTYAKDTFKTYVNGLPELSGTVNFTTQIVNTVGKVSIGSRMNQKAYYKGIVKTLKITHKALVPGEFLIDDTPTDRLSVYSSKRALRSYPNPAMDITYLKYYSPVEQEIEVFIYDILGNIATGPKIYTSRGENEIQLDVANLSNGMYLVLLKDDNNILSTKISVVR